MLSRFANKGHTVDRKTYDAPLNDSYATHTIKRAGRAEEGFWLNEHATFISGALLPVDGGRRLMLFR